MCCSRITLSPSPGFCIKTLVEPGNKKIFLNIAWDALVPPPPTGTTPEAIAEPDYLIPLVVGDLKSDKDKKGADSLVVDCVYSKELKSKSIRETDFKAFLTGKLVELLQLFTWDATYNINLQSLHLKKSKRSTISHSHERLPLQTLQQRASSTPKASSSLYTIRHPRHPLPRTIRGLSNHRLPKMETNLSSRSL